MGADPDSARIRRKGERALIGEQLGAMRSLIWVTLRKYAREGDLFKENSTAYLGLQGGGRRASNPQRACRSELLR